MDYIKSWLKTIVYMNILLLICDNLMQKTAYEKYYRFFSGFLLVLCLLKPVIDFMGTEPYFHASFLQEQWRSERNLLRNSEEFHDLEESVRKESETAYKNQIKELADHMGIEQREIAIQWDSGGESIRKIEIMGRVKKGKTEKKEDFTGEEKLKKVISQLYNVKESDIRIEVE